MYFCSRMNKLYQNQLATLLLSMLCVFQGYAQDSTNNTVRNVIQEATQVIAPYLDTVPVIQINGCDQNAYHLMTKTVFKRKAAEEYLKPYYLKQSEIAKKEWGLSLDAGYIENLNVPNVNVIDNSIYNRRVQVGVKWDILKNGFVANRQDAKYYENKAFLADYNYQEQEKEQFFLDRWNNIIYLFNQEKLTILSIREGLVDDQIEFARTLYYLKHLSKEEMLKYESTLAEIRGLKNLYASYNDQYFYENDSAVQVNDIPLYDINYEALVNHFSSPLKDTVKQMMEQQINLKNHWSNYFSLNTFFRYNFYDLTGPSSTRQFFSVGLGFSMPIPLNMKNNKELEAIKQKIEYAHYDDEAYQREKNILNLTYEYRYKLKQYIQFYQKRKVYEERLRKLRILKNSYEVAFNPIKANQMVNEMLSIDLELLDLKQNMYLKLLKIYSSLPFADTLDFVKQAAIPNYQDPFNDIERGIYVWSDAIADHSGYFLSEYIDLYQISNIIMVQPSKDSLNEKRYSWLPEQDSTRIEIMIGKNQLIYDDHPEEYISNLLLKVPVKAKGIHLDVEPHTFDDFKAHEQDYLDKYVAMLKKIRAYCDVQGLELTVSIPLHYMQQYTEQIFYQADRVYFMAYENIKIDYIQRKIEPYQNPFQEKIVIALRTDDFENRIALENHIQALKKATNIKKFVIHDMGSLIDLDKSSLLHEEY